MFACGSNAYIHVADKNVHIFKILVIYIAAGRYQLKFCVLLKVAELKTLIMFYFLIA